MRTRTVAFVAACGLAGWAAEAAAFELALEIDGCSAVSKQRVEELMALELAHQSSGPTANATTKTLVAVTCAERQVKIVVTDPATNQGVFRSFTLTEPEPDVRARAVALAAAELVITSAGELGRAPPTAPASTAVPPRPPARASDGPLRATPSTPAETERRTHVDALLAFAGFGGTFHARPGTWAAGLRLSLLGQPAWLAGDTDVSATFDDEGTALGDVRTNTWSLGVRPALRLAQGPWHGTLGLGARLGFARLVGSAADASRARGHVVTGPWGGPLVHMNVGFSSAHVALRLGAEAGFALRDVTGTVDANAEAGVRGPWFLTTLGLGWGA